MRRSSCSMLAWVITEGHVQMLSTAPRFSHLVKARGRVRFRVRVRARARVRVGVRVGVRVRVRVRGVAQAPRPLDGVHQLAPRLGAALDLEPQHGAVHAVQVLPAWR